MSITGYKSSEGVDIGLFFLAGNSGITTGYKNSEGTDLGSLFLAGNSGITTGYKNSEGGDLGSLFARAPMFSVIGNGTGGGVGAALAISLSAITGDNLGNIYVSLAAPNTKLLAYNGPGTTSTPCNFIAKWNKTLWQPIGVGDGGAGGFNFVAGTGGGVKCIGIDNFNNLYALGSFNIAYNATNLSCKYICLWNESTSSWSNVGSPPTTYYGFITFACDLNNNIFTSGAGSNIAYKCTTSPSYVWTTLTIAPIMSGYPSVLVNDINGNIYVGGNPQFNGAGGYIDIAKFPNGGTAFAPLSNSTSGIASSSVISNMAIDNTTGNIYIVGTFTGVYNSGTLIPANGLAVVSSSGVWSALGNTIGPGSYTSIAIDPSLNLYFGGNGINLYKYSISTQTYSIIGNTATGGTISRLHFNNSNNALYASCLRTMKTTATGITISANNICSYF